MNDEVEYTYFVWLTQQIATPDNGKTWHELFSRMFDWEFAWIVPNDDNRIADALAVRTEFQKTVRKKLRLPGASILEVLVALSRRMAFTAGGDAEMWAWKMIKNLGLNRMSDPLTNIKAQKVEDTLDALVWRTYERNGRGGFFPLKYSAKDQTKVEIWYQMNEYVIEMEKS